MILIPANGGGLAHPVARPRNHVRSLIDPAVSRCRAVLGGSTMIRRFRDHSMTKPGDLPANTIKGTSSVALLAANSSPLLASSRPAMTDTSLPGNAATSGFPRPSTALEKFGLKFSAGGAHASRTMMLRELEALLAHVPRGSQADDYRKAVLQRNVLGKPTDSTRRKSLRHLSELYALDEAIPIFWLLRQSCATDAASLPLLAVQVAWARDPLFRATTPPVMDSSGGDWVETARLAQALDVAFPNQYSELTRNTIARNAASSWTQSGHLAGRPKKIRQQIRTTVVAVTMALFLGEIGGYHGASVFSNPWCRLLDLKPNRARAMGFEAHRAGLLNLRALGEIVELTFPPFAKFQEFLP